MNQELVKQLVRPDLGPNCLQMLPADDQSALQKRSSINNPIIFVCLFDLILYVPSTIFQLCRDRSSWVEPVLS